MKALKCAKQNVRVGKCCSIIVNIRTSSITVAELGVWEDGNHSNVQNRVTFSNRVGKYCSIIVNVGTKVLFQ